LQWDPGLDVLANGWTTCSSAVRASSWIPSAWRSQDDDRCGAANAVVFSPRASPSGRKNGS
jgi:hypothetical protein